MTNVDPPAEKARRKMVARRMTPEILAAQEGILAVFVGAHVALGDVERWWPAAARVEELSSATGSTDISVHLGRWQRDARVECRTGRVNVMMSPVVIRFMVVDDVHCIVVYRPNGRIMKSLPRSMRRCIEHVRKDMRKEMFDVSCSEMAGYFDEEEC